MGPDRSKWRFCEGKRVIVPGKPYPLEQAWVLPQYAGMKTIIAAFLVLAGIGNFARADNILIYAGADTDSQNSNSSHSRQLLHNILIFDLSTSSVASFAYGGIGKNKVYNLPVFYTFSFAPVTTSAETSATFFPIDNTSSLTGTFDYDMAVYSGNNKLYNLGGGFTGEYPGTLVHFHYIVIGDGTTLNDNSSVSTGVYHLDLPLTQQSNTSGDTRSTAILLVEAFLQKAGYQEL